jgi:hypothetical protein
MWTIAPGAEAQPTYRADLKGAASVANVYGRSAVAAGPCPLSAILGACARRSEAHGRCRIRAGVNRIHIHESAHQPLPDAVRPGLGAGQPFWASISTGTRQGTNGRWLDQYPRAPAICCSRASMPTSPVSGGDAAQLTSLYGDRVMEGGSWVFDFQPRRAADAISVGTGSW